jgi:hypothetical protein
VQHEAIAGEPAAEVAAPVAAPAAATLSPQARILALQRTAGNRAVAQMLARAERGTKPYFGDAPKLADGDWYADDRKANIDTWHTANEFNLRNGRNGEYPNPEMRGAFYRWFYQASTAKGHETRWALAASIVAAGANEIATLSGASEEILGTGINELQGMMREGNQIIFDNVFPKLRALYDSPTAVTGQAALDWDAKTLSEEQNLVQPLYGAASADALKLLEGIAKGDWLTKAGATISSASSVEKGDGIAPGDVPYFDKTGNLKDVAQRYAYGMKLASTFSTVKPSGTLAAAPPPPDAAYLDGSALRAVDTRHNLHFLDAIIDSNVTPDEQEQAVKRLALFTPSEQATFLSSYADRIARCGMYPYRLLEALTPWKFDLEAQLSFIDAVFKKQGHPWGDIKYSQVKTMITNASPASRKKIKGARWKKIFIDICDDDDIDAAVADLQLDEPERKEWVDAEKSIF